MQSFEAAREDIQKLKEVIDNQTFAAPLVQLQQRTWLMHWALFVFWNHEKGRDDLVDLFMSPPYLAAIQINAQHLLRYLATAVVVQKKRRSNVQKELIRCARLGRRGGRGSWPALVEVWCGCAAFRRGCLGRRGLVAALMRARACVVLPSHACKCEWSGQGDLRCHACCSPVQPPPPSPLAPLLVRAG